MYKNSFQWNSGLIFGFSDIANFAYNKEFYGPQDFVAKLSEFVYKKSWPLWILHPNLSISTISTEVVIFFRCQVKYALHVLIEGLSLKFKSYVTHGSLQNTHSSQIDFFALDKIDNVLDESANPNRGPDPLHPNGKLLWRNLLIDNFGQAIWLWRLVKIFF